EGKGAEARHGRGFSRWVVAEPAASAPADRRLAAEVLGVDLRGGLDAVVEHDRDVLLVVRPADDLVPLATALAGEVHGDGPLAGVVDVGLGRAHDLPGEEIRSVADHGTEDVAGGD